MPCRIGGAWTGDQHLPVVVVAGTRGSLDHDEIMGLIWSTVWIFLLHRDRCERRASASEVNVYDNPRVA